MNSQQSNEVVSRPAMESIFLKIAFDAVEDAEEQEREALGSVSAQVQMQDRAITAIVMSVQALEAFINVQAKERLSSALWDSIEWLNITNKWLVVTRLATGKECEKGEQPFQDFDALVKFRNALVHYKPKYESGYDMFQNKFTGTMARRVFTAAAEMIEDFFQKAGEEVPVAVQPGTLTRGIIEVRPLFNKAD